MRNRGKSFSLLRQRINTSLVFFIFALCQSVFPVSSSWGSALDCPISIGYYPGTSFDLYNVIFHFDKDTFSIPRNYLIGGSDRGKENDVKNFTLLITLPNLKPLDHENSSQFSDEGFGDLIRILVSDRQTFVSRDEYFERIFEYDHSEKKIIGNDRGLEVYKVHGSLWKDLYVERDKDGSITFLMTCDFDDAPTKYKGCNVFSRYNNKISISYFFSKRYKYLAPEIDRNIISMIYSFENK